MSAADLLALSPPIIVAITSLVVMATIAFYREPITVALFSLMGIFAAIASVPEAGDHVPQLATTLIAVDEFALFFQVVILISAAAVCMMGHGYLQTHRGQREEFFLLVLFATLGACVLTAATHFASFFLALEILSVSLYGLIGFLREKPKSIEAGLKYLILAAAGSAFLLFGMALVYADTGSLYLLQIGAVFENRAGLITAAGIAMMLVGVGFKLALVPFHMWTPDVYEGAPAPVTAFIATASKGAVFAFLLRWTVNAELLSHPAIYEIFWWLAAASMIGGNLLALLQTDLKRLLAYSSIAHLGYALVPLLTGRGGAEAATFYLTGYVFTILTAFGCIVALSRSTDEAHALDDFRGLFWRRPWLSILMSVAMFSLAGIPLTAGFVGKFWVLMEVVQAKTWTLAFLVISTSAVGLYYYLRVVVTMFSRAEFPLGKTAEYERFSDVLEAGTAVAALMVVFLGIYPTPVIDYVVRVIEGMV